MNEEQLKQALQEAFNYGQRVGCSDGMGPFITDARQLKWDILVQKWLDVLLNDGNCEGCDGGCFSCPAREDDYE
jgi:hypothetical protein